MERATEVSGHDRGRPAMMIPGIMSTQHPDNVRSPFFAVSQDMSGDDEIQEACYAFSHLCRDELMGDCEGKEVVGKTALARVISFRAACYSLGLPPEVLGLNVLSKDDNRCLKEMHVNFPFDMQAAMSYFNEDVLTILPSEVKASLTLDRGTCEINQAHKATTSRIIDTVRNKDSANMQNRLVEAAHIGKFLG